MTVREKFEIVTEQMNRELFEREDDIHALLLAILSKNHIFFYGEPGVAKSMMIDLFHKLIIDATPDDLFKALVTEGTTPEEICGPPSLSAMRQDIWKRNTERMFPRARFAFLDELWNANSLVLNQLNPMLNEREFYNHDDDPAIPLWTLLAASNSLPRNDSLAAVADRIAIWRVVEPIHDDSNFESMLTLTSDAPQPCITLADIMEAHEEINRVEIPTETIEQIVYLRNALKERKITVSDRRYKQSLNILRAEAWLAGSDQVLVQHLRPLADILWRQLDQIDPVRDLVYTLSDPIEVEAAELWDQLKIAYSEFDLLIRRTEDIDELSLCARGIIDKYVKAVREVKELQEKSKSQGRRSKTCAEIIDWMKDTGSILVKDGLKINEEADFFKFD